MHSFNKTPFISTIVDLSSVPRLLICVDLYFVLLFTDSQQPDNVDDENAEPKYEDLDRGMKQLQHAENGSSGNRSDTELPTKRHRGFDGGICQGLCAPDPPREEVYAYAAVDPIGKGRFLYQRPETHALICSNFWIIMLTKVLARLSNNTFRHMAVFDVLRYTVWCMC